jgi:Domain of unknown function (DUF1905)/Bacteriocin-protection, YdeI or OmpD-Associated
MREGTFFETCLGEREMKAISFKAKIHSFPEFVGMHYLEVSPTKVKQLGGKFMLRLICTVNGKVRYHCALQGLGNGKGWIGLSKARMKALELAKGDTVSVRLLPDRSKYGLPMPAELKELLRQDEEGKKRFHKLKPGRQRNILHYVGQPKSSDARLERAIKVITNLKLIPEGLETPQAIFATNSRFNRQS